MENKYYYGIDWLRAFSCIGIMMMHMLTNNNYELSGFVFDRIIPSFTDLVYLFMVISSFGICSGYYKKVMNGSIRWTDFYKKRYFKILPFFTCLIALDLIMGFSEESLYEAIADISLLFGLFPNNITVIGVGWFLGLVFTFYLIFPFFCVLIENKKRAWLMFALSLVLNYICKNYFMLSRTNIVYSLCFFIAGGLIYLYRDSLSKIKPYISIPVAVVCVAAYYILGGNVYCCLITSCSLLILALTIDTKDIKAISFISSISMEIYLSHMVVFRIIEKVHLNTMFGNDVLQYAITVFIDLIGVIIFSFLGHTIINKIMFNLARLKTKKLSNRTN